MAYDAEAQYWKEDADRLNRMADMAHQRGYTVKAQKLAPPRLNPDGTEQKEKFKAVELGEPDVEE